MSTLDFIVLFIYLIGITSIGILAGRKQTSAQSFFLGDKQLPWWMVMISVVATETSALTFLSIPGLAYQSDLGFLQIAVGYIIGRWIVAKYLLPNYFIHGIESTYEFIKNQWGSQTQKFTSLIFLVTRILADGVRLFMTSIPLSLITGWPYEISIIIIGIFTLIYTLVGGIRSVIWTDTVQFVIYIFGAMTAYLVLSNLIGGGWSYILNVAFQNEKLTFIHIQTGQSFENIFSQPYHFITAIIGGIFLSMASHGTDHLIVQRILSCKNARDGKKAMIGSGILVFFQFAIFLLLGSGLWVYYQGTHQNPNEVFSHFITSALPNGLAGLIIAGILATAMSTLSSSINAMASSTLTDWIKDSLPQKYTLKTSRWISAIWGLVLIASARLFSGTDNPLVELGLSIASFTYGGLLGFFVIARWQIASSSLSVIFGFIVSLLVMLMVIQLTPIAWPWYTLIGVVSMTVSSVIIHKIEYYLK